MHRAPARFALTLSALALALPALAEMRIEKTLKLAPGGEFRLDTDMGKVTLVGFLRGGRPCRRDVPPQGPR